MDSNVTLFHPSGARCVLTLPEGAQSAFNAVSEYISAGFLANPPDTNGDKKDIMWVARCKKDNKELLYFYEPFSQFPGSNMTVYLDSDDDRARFERASGLTIENMPVVKSAPPRDSWEFGTSAIRVSFAVTCTKEAPSAKYATGRWILKDYIGFANPTTTQQPQPENGHGEPANYETEALNWFASNGVAFADVKVILGMEKLKFPETSDKAGWQKIMRDYAAITKKKAS